jgi:hypothetical protein
VYYVHHPKVTLLLFIVVKVRRPSRLGEFVARLIQKMTMAAREMADMQVWAQRSWRVWMRRR